MRGLEEIERMLGERLIPRGFSESANASLEALIDDLAAAEPPRPRARRGAGWAAAAAGLAIALAGGGWWHAKVPETQATSPSSATTPVAEQAIELLSESVGVVSAELDDEWRGDAEGNLLRAWHVQVVSEERFRDHETGHEIRVVSPSDELVLVPVSTF